MLFKELLNHFKIDEEFPSYLLDESFNDVFLDGEFTETDKNYKIVAKTRKKITHTMIIAPGDEFPVIVISELQTGALNGVKFGREKGSLVYIDEL